MWNCDYSGSTLWTSETDEADPGQRYEMSTSQCTQERGVVDFQEDEADREYKAALLTHCVDRFSSAKNMATNVHLQTLLRRNLHIHDGQYDVHIPMLGYSQRKGKVPGMHDPHSVS